MLIHVFPVCQGVGGALTVLMKDTIRPNLMQTLEVSFTCLSYFILDFSILLWNFSQKTALLQNYRFCSFTTENNHKLSSFDVNHIVLVPHYTGTHLVLI